MPDHPAQARYPYRVFVSYSHGDKEIAYRVRNRLSAIGAKPMSDLNLDPGLYFYDEIKRHITYAHIFVPILTPSGTERPWVHQEIGYAMGMGIPILPLAIGALPEGLTRQIQAVSVSEDLGNLEEKVTAYTLDNVIERSVEISAPNYKCAEKLVDRTKWLIKYSNDVIYLRDFGRVRIKASYGSFSIPLKHHSNPVWNLREGENRAPEEKRKMLRDEREALEIHAKEKGCDLILEPLLTKAHTPLMIRTRLEILVDFLESLDDQHVRIVLHPGKIDSNLTMVGDFFLAEAVVPFYGASYHLTTFTNHGPTVLRRIRDFDLELEDLLEQQHLTGEASRTSAIEMFKKEIDKL